MTPVAAKCGPHDRSAEYVIQNTDGGLELETDVPTLPVESSILTFTAGANGENDSWLWGRSSMTRTLPFFASCDAASTTGAARMIPEIRIASPGRHACEIHLRTAAFISSQFIHQSYQRAASGVKRYRGCEAA